MNSQPYTTTFTSGGLFLNESVTVVVQYLKTGDWESVREQMLIENLVQVRTISSAKKIIGEIIARLKELTTDELTILAEGGSDEQSQLLWLAICRRYKLTHDFAAEVLAGRYRKSQVTLKHEDYDIFYNNKAEWHLELERVAPATQKKMRQVCFRIMREAGLIDREGRIKPAFISPRLKNLLASEDLAIFPLANR